MHPLFRQEAAVAASAPEAPGLAGQFSQDIFECSALRASGLSNSANSISQLLKWGSLLSGVSTLLQLDTAIVPVLALGASGAITV